MRDAAYPFPEDSARASPYGYWGHNDIFGGPMKKRLRAFAILPALVPGLLTAMLAMPTAASAAAEAHNAKAPILRHNGACGASEPLKHIGFVNFHRVRNTVRLNVHLK